MLGMDVWDIAIFLAAGYLAVITLARLMRRHRDRLTRDLRRQIELQKRTEPAESEAAARPSRNAA